MSSMVAWLVGRSGDGEGCDTKYKLARAVLRQALQGASSPLLGLVHVLLLRQAQAVMEEAHATGVLQVGWLVCFIGRWRRARKVVCS
jgi:hypothetical protein